MRALIAACSAVVFAELFAPLARAAECLVETPAEGVSMARPVDGSVLREFGNQYDEIAKAKTDHTGVDLESAEGEPVFAARGGKVVEAGEKGELGNYIRIDDGNGLETGYGHLSAFSVRIGDCVKPGQEIGKAGKTGKAPAFQVHFEVLNSGEPVDPLPYLQ